MFENFHILSKSKYYKLLSKVKELNILSASDLVYHTYIKEIGIIWTSNKKSNISDGYKHYAISNNNYDRYILDSIPCNVLPARTYNSIRNKCYDIKDYGNYKIVKYGEYPMSRVHDAFLIKALEEEYNNNKLNKTGKFYNITFGSNREKRIEYSYNNMKFIKVNYDFYKVEPIEWVVFNDNTIIPKKLIIPTLKYDEAYEYIRDVFAFDIKPSKLEYEQVSVPVIEEEEVYESKTDDINPLVDEIKSLLHNYYGNKDYIGIMNKLFDNYNKNIDMSTENEIANDVVDRLTLKYKSAEYLLEELMHNINKIKSELISYNEEYKEQISMINYIDELDSILYNKDIKKYNKEIYKYFDILRDNVLPFLSDKSYLHKLEQLLKREKDNIKNYINSDNKDENYSNFDIFEFNFRLKYQEYLIKVSEEVRKEDLILDIKRTFINLMENKTYEIKSGYVKYYLAMMNNIYDFIVKNGSEDDISKAKKVIEEGIDFNNDISQIVSDFDNKFKKLERIRLDIEAPLKIKNRNESYKLKIKIARAN